MLSEVVETFEDLGDDIARLSRIKATTRDKELLEPLSPDELDEPGTLVTGKLETTWSARSEYGEPRPE